MYGEKDPDLRTVEILRTAFKNYLDAQIGRFSEKSSLETQAWILALRDVAYELRMAEELRRDILLGKVTYVEEDCDRDS